jgi:hypothetical protein
MPRRTRTSRLVVILAAGVVAALPLLAAGPAEGAGSGGFRQAASASTPQIEFSSAGPGLLTCGSKPSDDQLTVPAESTVIFVNKLGDDAMLRINGRDAKWVPEDHSSEVLFHTGTVRVEMVPDCGLSLSTDIKPVSVTVAMPAGSASVPSSRGPASSGAASPPGASTTPSRRGSHEDRASASPAGSASAASSGPPAGAIGSSPQMGAGDRPVAGDDQAVAAEPVSAEPSRKKDGPNGLLTLIAVVCLVGVSVGAIRAIAAQRATRTSVA